MRREKDIQGNLPDAARRLRIKAEECRMTAEVTANETARSTYLHLAQSYEGLAERVEGCCNDPELGPGNAADRDRTRIRAWRMRAEELRTLAENMGDPSARLGMLNAAATYDGLADDAETPVIAPI